MIFIKGSIGKWRRDQHFNIQTNNLKFDIQKSAMTLSLSIKNSSESSETYISTSPTNFYLCFGMQDDVFIIQALTLSNIYFLMKQYTF